MKLSWPYKNYGLSFSTKNEQVLTEPFWIDLRALKSSDLNHFKLEKSEEFTPNPNYNRLINGDNLFCLELLRYESNDKKNHKQINCVYIDPPYNTGKTHYQYYDSYEHLQWLSLMYPRLRLLHSLLSEDGIILIQIDDEEHAYMDLMLQEIFGAENKLGTIIWRRRQSQANLKKTVSTIHDYILVYSKNVDICNYNFPQEMKNEGILWTNTKKFGHNQKATKEIHTYFGDKTIFSTPKPEILIHYLLKSFSKQGDVVLDCFAGSGSTLAVAHKMNRSWIGIELSPKNYRLCKKRMLNVIQGKKNTKHSQDMQWTGGGGFQCEILSEELETIQTEFRVNKEHLKNNVYAKLKTQGSKNIEMVWKYQKAKKTQNIQEFQQNRQITKNFSPWLEQKTKDRLKRLKDTQKIQLATIFMPEIFENSVNMLIRTSSPNLSNIFITCVKTLWKSLSKTGFLSVLASEENYSVFKFFMDKRFGRKNHISTFIWKNRNAEKGVGKKMNDDGQKTGLERQFDYVLLYAKNLEEMKFKKLPPSKKFYKNPDDDPRGAWLSHPLVASKKSQNKKFTYKFQDGREVTRKWRYPPQSIKKLEQNNRIHYTQPRKGVGVPRVKKFYKDRLKEYEETGKRGTTPNSLLLERENYGTLQTALDFQNSIEIDNYKVVPFRSDAKIIGFLSKITSAKKKNAFHLYEMEKKNKK